MHTELKNDITLQMETDYGRIRMQIDIENDTETRYVIFLLCNYQNVTKCGIKVHLARKHDELQQLYDLKCPFRPKTYKDLSSINRHLYKKQCSQIKEKVRIINWQDVWKQICLVNNPVNLTQSIQQHPSSNNPQNETSSSSNTPP